MRIEDGAIVFDSEKYVSFLKKKGSEKSARASMAMFFRDLARLTGEEPLARAFVLDAKGFSSSVLWLYAERWVYDFPDRKTKKNDFPPRPDDDVRQASFGPIVVRAPKPHRAAARALAYLHRPDLDFVKSGACGKIVDAKLIEAQTFFLPLDKALNPIRIRPQGAEIVTMERLRALWLG